MTPTKKAKRRFARYVEARKQFWWPQVTQPRMFLSPAMIGHFTSSGAMYERAGYCHWSFV